MKIVDNFSKAAPNYNENCDIQRHFAQNFAQIAKKYIKKDSFGVDLGSGTGIVSSFFKDLNLIELDFSSEMLNQSKCDKKIKADFENLPFKENSLDFVISSFSLQWAKDFNVLFSQIHKILKKDGIFAFCIPVNQSLQEIKTANIESGCNFSIVDLPKKDEILQFLQQNKFKILQNEEEILKKNYFDAIDCLKKIKKIGASSNFVKKNFVGQKKIEKFNDFFLNRYNNVTCWNVEYFIYQK